MVFPLFLQDNPRVRTIFLFFLQDNPHARTTMILVCLNNNVAVRCLDIQSTSKSTPLLRLSMHIFKLACRCIITLRVVHLLGSDNTWPDAFSIGQASSVNFLLQASTFARMCHSCKWTPSLSGYQVSFLSSSHDTKKTNIGRGPERFSGGLEHVGHHLLVSPFSQQHPVLGVPQVTVSSFRGSVILLAPLWPKQP